MNKCACGQEATVKCRQCHKWACRQCWARQHGKGSDGRHCGVKKVA